MESERVALILDTFAGRLERQEELENEAVSWDLSRSIPGRIPPCIPAPWGAGWGGEVCCSVPGHTGDVLLPFHKHCKQAVKELLRIQAATLHCFRPEVFLLQGFWTAALASAANTQLSGLRE